MEQVSDSSSKEVLAEPVREDRSLTTEDRRNIDLSKKIPGWGSDLEDRNRPGVPMDKAPMIGIETLYPEIDPQIPKIKIHKSTEHAKMTPVFGTSCPPRGLSGLIRDFAYSRGEGNPVHWLSLMIADRVDAAEGILSDLVSLRVPNIPKEMGLKAEFKRDRIGIAIAKNLAVGSAIIGGFLLLKKMRTVRS